MNRAKTLSLLACLVLLTVALPPNARADEWNKKTILTVNEPVAVPGKVLQPGKYVMKLLDSPANRHIVQIYNEDESQLQTTVLAIPNQRLQPTGKTQFGFWEMPADQPKALRSWFYPGDNFGQEFAYPKDIAAQIAKTNNTNVPAIVSGEDNLATAKVEPMTPEGNIQGENQSATASQNTDTTMAQTQPAPEQSNASSSAAQSTATTPPTPSPDTTAQSTPAPNPTPAPTDTTAQSTPAPSTASSTATTDTSSQTASSSQRRLPSTGSPFPLVGLGGLLSIGSAMLLRVASRRRR